MRSASAFPIALLTLLTLRAASAHAGDVPLIVPSAPTPPADTTAPAAPVPEAIAHAIALVDKNLVVPLAAAEEKGSRFTRARIPPSARRVRIDAVSPETDGKGAAFFTFAVDERVRFPDDTVWNRDAMVGCVYPESGAIFVRSGTSFRPAAHALFKKTAPAAAHICTAAVNPDRS